MDYKTLGWQDILVKVPSDWEMFFEKKKPKKQKKEVGYFGFRDLKSKRLEIRWVRYELKHKPKIKDAFEDYKKILKKSQKDINKRAEGTNEIKSHESRYLYWELRSENDEGIQGYLVNWICDESLRLFICQSQFPIKESSIEKPLMMEIISQVNCHPKGDFTKWSLPNLQVSTPLGMKLIKRNILIALSFIQLRNKDLDLLAYRIGLAEQKVKNDDELPDWFKSYFKDKLPDIPSNYKPDTFEKFLFEKKQTIWKGVQKKEKKISLSNRYYETYIWSNLEKNDIYCTIIKMKKLPSSKIEKLIEKMIKMIILNN
ncbi:MAG: hypothetical protein ACXAC7_03925 [Candidatus Hodarchaeales archaeon]|jgi:hypothetical protein